MKRAKVQTEVRRPQIVQAVLDIVASHGTRAVSMAAVAGKLGLVPSAIYRHFRSKGDCLEAAMNLVGQKLQANFQEAVQAGHSPLDRLERLLILHIQMVRENIAIPRIVFGEDVHAAGSQRREQAQAIFGAYVGAIAGLVRQAQADGSIRSDLPAETAAMMFLGMVIPAGIRWHLSQGQFDLASHAQHAWRMYRDALVVRDNAVDQPAIGAIARGRTEKTAIDAGLNIIPEVLL